MREREPPRVQELAFEAELAWPSVDGVARDRETDGRKVRADLVGPAGLEPHVEQGVTFHYLAHLELGDRLTRLVGVERLPQRVAPIAPDRRLDPAAAGSRASDDERDVVPFQCPAADQILQTAVSLLGPGDDH